MTQGLSRQQKETAVLLSIGTFLEYFDLMLYIHMAVLLNGLFFPQDDPVTAQLFAAFTFCSAFILRPVGGLIIGWIGDQVGRKSTIMLTTGIMALCCVTMATVGTYEEIGITASIIVIICRILQGFSSLGEALGASLYFMETLKRPYNYIADGVVDLASYLGELAALMVASFVLAVHFNWRIAFWIGAVIAVVGLVARRKLRETPEFIDFKRRMKIKMEIMKQNPGILKDSNIYKEKIDKRTVFSYFAVRLIPMTAFYIAYVYMGDFMQKTLNMTPEEVIYQNLRLTVVIIVGVCVTVYFLKRYHPVKVAKVYVLSFIIFLLFLPYFLPDVRGLFVLTCVQFMAHLLALCSESIGAVFFKHLPIARRFTILATTFGVSAALAVSILSFSLIPLEKYLGHYCLWVIFTPVVLGFVYAIRHAQKLEEGKGRYYNYPDDTDAENADTMKLEEEDSGRYDFGDNPAYQAYHADCQYAHSLLGVVAYRMQLSNRKVNIKLIKKAIIFAKKWHDGQFRETGEPFYSHPLAVASIVTDYHLKTDVIVGAILHDVVEDTECPLALIVEEFNPRIAQIVDRLTRVRLDENGVRTKWPLQETMERLHRDHDYEALLIKQIDRLHNLETIGHKSREKQEKIAIETHHHLMTAVGYVADKLNIGNVLSLENKLFKCCRDILLKIQ